MPVGPVSNQYLFSPNRAPIDLQLNQGQSQNPFTSCFTSSGVAIDYDGDPEAYAPPGSGLVGRDDLKYATSSTTRELSHSVIGFGNNGQPLINSSGYYVSLTSLQITKSSYRDKDNIQNNYVNANAISYIALGKQQTKGAQPGDYVYVHNDTTGARVLTIYADSRGSANNRGIELSEEAARELGVKFNRKNGVVSRQSVTTTIYPGSGLFPFRKPHLPNPYEMYY